MIRGEGPGAEVAEQEVSEMVTVEEVNPGGD